MIAVELTHFCDFVAQDAYIHLIMHLVLIGFNDRRSVV